MWPITAASCPRNWLDFFLPSSLAHSTSCLVSLGPAGSWGGQVSSPLCTAAPPDLAQTQPDPTGGKVNWNIPIWTRKWMPPPMWGGRGLHSFRKTGKESFTTASRPENQYLWGPITIWCGLKEAFRCLWLMQTLWIAATSLGDKVGLSGELMANIPLLGENLRSDAIRSKAHCSICNSKNRNGEGRGKKERRG